MRWKRTAKPVLMPSPREPDNRTTDLAHAIAEQIEILRIVTAELQSVVQQQAPSTQERP